MNARDENIRRFREMWNADAPPILSRLARDVWSDTTRKRLILEIKNRKREELKQQIISERIRKADDRRKKSKARDSWNRREFEVFKMVNRSQWKKVDQKKLGKLFPQISRVWPKICDLERKLNGGLLAQEAEVAYPRMKLYDKPIFRVTLRK